MKFVSLGFTGSYTVENSTTSVRYSLTSSLADNNMAGSK